MTENSLQHQWEENLFRFKRAVRCELFFEIYYEYIYKFIDDNYSPKFGQKYKPKPTEFLIHYGNLSHSVMLIDLLSLLEPEIEKKKKHHEQPLNLSTLLQSAKRIPWFVEQEEYLANNLSEIRKSDRVKNMELYRKYIAHGVSKEIIKDIREDTRHICWDIWNLFLTYFPFKADIQDDFDFGIYQEIQKKNIYAALKGELEKIEIYPEN